MNECPEKRRFQEIYCTFSLNRNAYREIPGNDCTLSLKYWEIEIPHIKCPLEMDKKRNLSFIRWTLSKYTIPDE